MVCEAVPGAKGAQRRRKVFSTLSYLTFSDRLSAAQYIYTVVSYWYSSQTSQCSSKA